MDALYRKSLRISSAAKSELGAGKVVNLQSNDAGAGWMQGRSAACLMGMGSATGGSHRGRDAGSCFRVAPVCPGPCCAAKLWMLPTYLHMVSCCPALPCPRLGLALCRLALPLRP